jgi:hypothetical protein
MPTDRGDRCVADLQRHDVRLQHPANLLERRPQTAARNPSKASCDSHTSTTIQVPSGVEPAAWLMTPSGQSAWAGKQGAMVRFPWSCPS